MTCRFCNSEIETVFAGLGMSPLSNAYVRPAEANAAEAFYPLTAYVCHQCFLVQVPSVTTPEAIFSDYAYFSSYSDSWLDHCRRYAEQMISRLALTSDSLVLEVASNDGYLLRWFQDGGIPVLGIEPAINVAQAAIDAGIPTISRFFGSVVAGEIIRERGRANLLVGNNVLAHVPELNDFVAGLKIALAKDGLLTMEFPHLLRLIQLKQFDTIYHEHFSYFSLGTVLRLFEAHGLQIFDVDRLNTHGGSIRIHAGHVEESRATMTAVHTLLEEEKTAGLGSPEVYENFRAAVENIKRELLTFLIGAKKAGKRIAGYGAPAKGNTLLNYCGIGPDFLDFTVDRNPHKQGMLLPGTRIEIRAPEALYEEKPDYVLILPWNLRDEIIEQTASIREWGGRWLVAIPELTVID